VVIEDSDETDIEEEEEDRGAIGGQRSRQTASELLLVTRMLEEADRDNRDHWVGLRDICERLNNLIHRFPHGVCI
jgi:hypothetical protein